MNGRPELGTKQIHSNDRIWVSGDQLILP